jgi:hypothetical protein
MKQYTEAAFKQLYAEFHELKLTISAYDKAINSLPTTEKISLINTIPNKYIELSKKFIYIENEIT